MLVKPLVLVRKTANFAAGFDLREGFVRGRKIDVYQLGGHRSGS
jgi:hypothetical protein